MRYERFFIIGKAMTDRIEIKLLIEKNWERTTVYIKCRERNDDVEAIIKAVQAYSDSAFPPIMAYCDEEMEYVPQRRIIRLYIHNRKVMIETLDKTYEIRKPLHEIEENLDKARFVRISQSETINLRKVKKFDFSLAGTIRVELENGENTYVARRRVKDLKKLLTAANL